MLHPPGDGAGFIRRNPPMDPKTVLRYAVDEQVKFVDIRFTDLPGAWHHLTLPINRLTEDSFESGIAFDALSLRGWTFSNPSDLLLVPDPDRLWIDPFYEEPTLCLLASVVDPTTKEGYDLDPRTVAARAETYLRFTGIADSCFFGPEAEFFVFDHVSYHN